MSFWVVLAIVLVPFIGKEVRQFARDFRTVHAMWREHDHRQRMRKRLTVLDGDQSHWRHIQARK